MKCPTCFSTMKCISEIHLVPKQPWRQRMDLHCYNRLNNDGKTPNICQARCHMGVITEDPKEWVCHEYSFSFKHEEKSYILRSYDYLVDPYHQNRRYEARTTLEVWTFTPMPILVDLPFFMPISTGNDMHERAWELFHRLRNLVVYS